MALTTQLGEDKYPSELNAESKEPGLRQDVVGGEEDYSVERVEKVYR